MAGTAKKWGVGCGIGCGVVLLVLGGLGACGYFGVRKIVDRADGIESSFEELSGQFGRPQEFTPDPAGRIAPARMEVFLAVREQLQPSRREASLLMERLDEGTAGPARVVGKIQAGLRFIPAMLAFIEERNRTLLEHGMGLGEYQFIYAVAYFAYLDKDPADGPDFPVSGPEDESGDHGPVRWGIQGHREDAQDVRAERDKEVRRHLNQSLGGIVRNQLEALDAGPAGGSGRDLADWRAELAAEAEAMGREPRRILWEQGLPQPLRESLEPYRDRLEAAYDELVNVVEVGLFNRE